MQPLEKHYHQILAEYFMAKPLFFKSENEEQPNVRKFIEQPWQQTLAEMWNEATGTLCNLYFIEAKVRAGMVYELQEDYSFTLGMLPDALEVNDKERANQANLRRYIEDWLNYSENTTERLVNISSAPIWDEERSKSEIDRLKSNTSRYGKMAAFARFILGEADVLSRYGKSSFFCIQHAYNMNDSGPVGAVAETIIDQIIDQPLLINSNHYRSAYNPLPVLLKTIECSNRAIEVGITTNDKRFVSVSADEFAEDHVIQSWDFETGKCIRIMKPDVFSNSKFWLTRNEKYVFKTNTGFNASTEIELWDWTQCRCCQTLTGHNKWVTSIDMTPNGRWAVSGSEDATARVWDLATGQCLRVIPGNFGAVSGVCITADGKRIISIYEGQFIKVWDVQTGVNLKSIKDKDIFLPLLKITPDGKKAITVYGWDQNILKIWDLEKGIVIKTVSGLKGHISSIDLTPDGKRAVLGNWDWLIQIWDLEVGLCVKTLEGHTDKVNSVNISYDGRFVISGSDDRTIRVWNIENGIRINTSLLKHLGEVGNIAVAPNHQYLVSGSGDHTLKIWDFETGTHLNTLKGHHDYIAGICIIPDGRHIISGSGKDPRDYEEDESKEFTIRIWDCRSGESIRQLDGHSKQICNVKVSPDGKYLFSGSKDSAIRMWDWMTGKCIATFVGHQHGIHDMVLSPEGRRILSGGGNQITHINWADDTPDSVKERFRNEKDHTIRIWDPETGQCLKVLNGHTGYISRLALSPDGRLVVSGSDDRTIRVWNVATGLCLQTLAGHQFSVLSVSITPDGRTVISGSEDGTVRTWNPVDGRLLNVFAGHTREVFFAASTENGRELISAGNDNIIRLWDILTGECLALYHVNSRLTSITTVPGRPSLLIGLRNGEIIRINRKNAVIKEWFVTPERIWLYGNSLNRGKWDQDITTVCPWCGSRFTVAGLIVDVITSINRTNSITDEDSPCLKLPNEAWDEPKLLSECPNCGGRLRFNPFIVDSRDSNIHLIDR
jgi:WD40 repeat protein